MNYLARIRIPAKLARWVIVIIAPLVAAGIVLIVGEPITDYITRNLSEEEKKKHLASRAVTWISFLAAVVIVLFFSLPAFGITPLGDPFNIAL